MCLGTKKKKISYNNQTMVEFDNLSLAHNVS